MIPVPRPVCAFLIVPLLPLLVFASSCKSDGPRPAPATPPPADRADAPSNPRAGAPAARAQAATKSAPDDCPDLADAPSKRPAPDRIVAIGDIHGDIVALREVLSLAGAIDGDNNWSGGDLIVVQTGDLLDRGDTERAILDWLVDLREQARAAGGDLLLLNGNHELMNAAWDFRYVTEGGFREFADVSEESPAARQSHPIPAEAPAEWRGRARAFRPGGPYARQLAAGNIVQMVGDTVFVHGGVTAHYAAYGLDRLNRELRCWLADSRSSPRAMPRPGRDSEGPVWTRRFSLDPPDCADLDKSLAILGAARMVVGHTVQNSGVTSACDGKIWRIDTGIAGYYGGPRQALEIRGSKLQILGGPARPETRP